MANPKTNTITDIFLPDGYGAFQYGAGGYGGTLELLNPQWNVNSGNFYVDPVSGLPAVEATNIPSYVSASAFDISNSTFFAKVVPAPNGNGGIQTAMIIRNDSDNFVEVSVGPQGVFSFYGVNEASVVLPASPLPVYDPVAHAYWRIRNDGFVFHFDVAPDGATWTELGNVTYDWDATNISVMFFVGYTGSETLGQLALISHVNLSGTTLALSATNHSTAAAGGQALVTNPLTVAARTSGKFGVSAKFTATLGLPEGGMTDWSYTETYQDIDPLITTFVSESSFNINGHNPLTRADWTRTFWSTLVPPVYRDGSYFPPAQYFQGDYANSSSLDATPTLYTDAQVENSVGWANRLSVNTSTYQTGTFYAPDKGVKNVFQSTALVQSGQYSGAITSTNTPGTLGTGQLAYWIKPTSVAFAPVSSFSGSAEPIFGSVSLATLRAGTQWFVGLQFYDVNFNLVSGSATTNASLPVGAVMTHPGGNVWQTSVASTEGQTGVFPPTTAVWCAAVPVVLNPSSLVETVYTTNHFVTGAEVSNLLTPSAYNTPKTMNINVKADRVNYAINGGFNQNTNGWSQTNVFTTGSPTPVTQSWDGTTGFQSVGSMKLSYVPQSGTFSGTLGQAQLGTSNSVSFMGGTNGNPFVRGLKVGHTYTISMWILQGTGCPDVLFNFYDANFQGVTNVSTNAARAANGSTNGWVQVLATITIPPTGLPDLGCFIYVKYNDYLLNQTFNFWVDGILVEESQTANSFFDGGFAGADYQWEAGGTANASRSYLYKNYTNKLTRLNRALPTVMPVGGNYNLLFAQPIVFS